VSRATGWAILLALLECLLWFAYFWPLPIAGKRMTVASSVFTNWVPMEPNMYYFGMLVALPATVIACMLIDKQDE
jgi:hypothetical protein